MDVEEIKETEVTPVASEENTVVEAQVDAGNQRHDQDVNWANARSTMAEQATEVRELKRQLSELNQKQVEASKKSLLDGRDGGDIITVDDFKNSLAEKESQYNSQIAELKAQVKHKDYAEVLNKYGKNLPAEYVETIRSSRNPYETAYVFCKNLPEYVKDNQVEHANVKKINENLAKPGNASAAGSEAVLSNASKYKSMSSNDILSLHRRFTAGS